MSGRDIEKLRRKFILIAMLSIFLAMLFIGGLLNLTNYFVSQREIWWTLDGLLADNGDAVEHRGDAVKRPVSLAEVFALSYHRDNFYLFVYDGSGTETDFRAGWMGEGSEDTAREAAQAALGAKRERGRVGVFAYRKTEDADGGIRLALLDTSSAVFTRMRLLYATGGVAFLGMLITFFLVLAFSRRAVEPEIENSRRQDAFITNASHELKTPLAVIRANTEMTELTEGESEWTQSTIKQVDRMNGLIQNLVMITRTREQENRGKREVTDISAAVRESVSPFEAMTAQQGKTLETAISDGVTLVTDGSAIRQLTTLLTDNAVKYCDDGGVIRIALEQNKRGRGALLTVSNSYADGQGVDTSRFFDRFYRQDESHNIDRGGYGIGLSIAESICENCGGSIEAVWRDGVISFICQLY